MMLREVGDPTFPIWLLGDSEPIRWAAKLDEPLDPRHPIRHNIWTSVADVIQDVVYRTVGRRVAFDRAYVRNAVGDVGHKPRGGDREWSDPAVQGELSEFRGLLGVHQPTLVLCFGAFAYEFGRRAQGRSSRVSYGSWGAVALGEAFRITVGVFDPEKVNMIPLLHRSIAGGKFLESHHYFTGDPIGNYFRYVGGEIAGLILGSEAALPEIWVPKVASRLSMDTGVAVPPQR